MGGAPSSTIGAAAAASISQHHHKSHNYGSSFTRARRSSAGIENEVTLENYVEHPRNYKALKLTLSDGTYSSQAKNSDAVLFNEGSHFSLAAESVWRLNRMNPFIQAIDLNGRNLSRRMVLLKVSYLKALGNENEDIAVPYIDRDVQMMNTCHALGLQSMNPLSDLFEQLAIAVATSREAASSAARSRGVSASSFTLSLRSSKSSSSVLSGSSSCSSDTNSSCGEMKENRQNGKGGRTKFRQMKQLIASLWQDKDLRWDDPDIVSSFSPGEIIIESWDSIEDTKGVGGPGLVIMTNHRFIWISSWWKVNLGSNDTDKPGDEGLGGVGSRSRESRRSFSRLRRSSQKPLTSAEAALDCKLQSRDHLQIMDIKTNISIGWDRVVSVEIGVNTSVPSTDTSTCVITAKLDQVKFEFIFTAPSGSTDMFQQAVKRKFDIYKGTCAYRDVLVRDPFLMTKYHDVSSAAVFVGEKFAAEWGEVHNVTSADKFAGVLTATTSRMIWYSLDAPDKINISIPFIAMKSISMRELSVGLPAAVVVSVLDNFGGFVLGFASSDYAQTVQLFQCMRRLHVVSTLRPYFGPLNSSAVVLAEQSTNRWILRRNECRRNSNVWKESTVNGENNVVNKSPRRKSVACIRLGGDTDMLGDGDDLDNMSLAHSAAALRKKSSEGGILRCREKRSKSVAMGETGRLLVPRERMISFAKGVHSPVNCESNTAECGSGVVSPMLSRIVVSPAESSTVMLRRGSFFEIANEGGSEDGQSGDEDSCGEEDRMCVNPSSMAVSGMLGVSKSAVTNTIPNEIRVMAPDNITCIENRGTAPKGKGPTHCQDIIEVEKNRRDNRCCEGGEVRMSKYERYDT